MKKFLKIPLQILKWIFIIFVVLIFLFFTVRFIGQRINNKTLDGGINEQMYVYHERYYTWFAGVKIRRVFRYIARNCIKGATI